MKRNNNGFTLVELVVVFAIIAIIAGLIGVSVSTATNAKAKRCAAEINSYIAMGRTNCLSRTGNVYIVLRKNGKDIVGEYYEGSTTTPTETEVFGGSPIEVSYTIGSETKTLEEAEPNVLKIKFDRSTGALSIPAGEQDVTIEIKGGAHTYTITMFALTGNHSMS